MFTFDDRYILRVFEKPLWAFWDHGSEMEKRADGADASVLFFLLCCANFLAVYAQIR